MPRPYANKSLAPRGGHKANAFGEDRIISISFTFAEWCSLKVIANERNLPMKRLIVDAFTKVYGEPKVEHVVKVTGKSPEEVTALLEAEAASRKAEVAKLDAPPRPAGALNPIAEKMFLRRKS